MNIHIPGGVSVQAPRYVVSATGRLLKFGGLATGMLGIVSTELQFQNGEISNAHRWTNHTMSGIGFIGPYGMAASMIYSGVGEDMVFKGKAPNIIKSDWVEKGLIPPAF